MTRFDLKDSKSHIELNEKDNKILLASADEFKLKAVIEILQGKLVKRNVPLKGLIYGTDSTRRGLDRAAGGHAAAGHLRSRRRATSSSLSKTARRKFRPRSRAIWCASAGKIATPCRRSWLSSKRHGFRDRHAVHELPVELMARRIESHMHRRSRRETRSVARGTGGSASRKRRSLVCHPHPQHGGTMHNKVVYRMARGLRQIGSSSFSGSTIEESISVKASTAMAQAR